MTKIDRKKRPRRLASDEAHTWARNLKLGNIAAKLVLSMLTLYVDHEGVAFVGIASLAEDCEMSPDTVRRRLVWLEAIGAIVRVPQWLDENGNRNSTARGKRTTDLIRLLTDADPEVIEALAAGESIGEAGDDADAISPSSQQGLNPEAETVSPAPALGQPSHCGEGLTSEPEPESPLKSPPGTRESAAQGEDVEPEDFAPAWQGWDGHEVMRRDLALIEFRQLTSAQQRLCRAAVPLFMATQKRLGRTRVMNFHLWVRTRGFEEFPDARLPDKPPERIWIAEAGLAGWQVAFRIVDRRVPALVNDPERGPGIWRLAPIPPDLAALAVFAVDDPAAWAMVPKDSKPFGAWRARLRDWIGFEPEPVKVFTEPHDPAVHDLSPSHPKFRFRKAEWGLRVPCPWPPKKDGTLYTAADAPIAPTMTDDNAKALANEGNAR